MFNQNDEVRGLGTAGGGQGATDIQAQACGQLSSQQQRQSGDATERVCAQNQKNTQRGSESSSRDQKQGSSNKKKRAEPRKMNKQKYRKQYGSQGTVIEMSDEDVPSKVSENSSEQSEQIK